MKDIKELKKDYEEQLNAVNNIIAENVRKAEHLHAKLDVLADLENDLNADAENQVLDNENVKDESEQPLENLPNEI